ncbi:hypothetical protein KP003_16815 [Geomonas nitrogeniifigens]|uniref:hypothetical protein n=1 Tax=Geomonas diazotrophica TaxID=2843197 RepID=UPI001C2B842A|nr:hypothetical protein [Geomonas nitrogeniifigens]QXE86004.1 hypothetical protein KP003_16815 [Geomonas nitrogeniifigens]
MVNRIRRIILVIRHALALWHTLNLPKNAAKGDWRQQDHFHLLHLLKAEVEELAVALWEWETGKGMAQRVEEEAADVSAFAAMVADKAKEKAVGAA